jgi:hypothetical protein
MENDGVIIPTVEPPDSATSNHLVAKHEELAKDMMNCALRNISSILRTVLLTYRKILRCGADVFTSPP